MWPWSKIFKTYDSTCENAIADKTQTTGVRVSINLTITPAKYTADIAYNTTESKKIDEIAKFQTSNLLTKNPFIVYIFNAKPYTSRKSCN